MKKRIIIIITIVSCITIGIFSVIKFDLISKIENKIHLLKIKNEILTEANEKYSDEPELITETFTDKDGNEIAVEMRKIVVKDEATGQELLMYEDAAEPKIIYVNSYKGKIEKIEGSKVFFIVDREFKKTTGTENNPRGYEIFFNGERFILNIF